MAVAAASCSKEYSCENNCRLNPVVNDTTHTGPIISSDFHYFSISYQVALAGTGNNAWGYSIPAFDTLSGILDSVEINMFTTVTYHFSLANNSNDVHSYFVNVSRRDSLSFDSIAVINKDYAFYYGPYNIQAQTNYRDSLSIINNIESTAMLTAQLNKFIGTTEIAFDFTPASISKVSGDNYSFNGSFRDSSYIVSTYHYKKKLK